MSDSYSHFLWQSIPVYLVVAFLFFLVGFVIGWVIWRHSRRSAKEIERRNSQLREEYFKLKKGIQSAAN